MNTDSRKRELICIKPETDSLNVLCEAFLLDSTEVNIFDTINGYKINKVQNDFKDELIYSVRIYSQENDWYYVSFTYREIVISGWIKNESQLATYSKNYNDTLFVYQETEKNHMVCSIPDYFISPMIILECKKDWVKVYIRNEDFKCIGWVPQNMTCSNPYTTCN